jgi:hypothetical protein
VAGEVVAGHGCLLGLGGFAGPGRARGGQQERGGVTEIRGLYFLGLTWQHTRGSALLGFVHDDAAYLADRIAAHRRATPVPSLPADKH